MSDSPADSGHGTDGPEVSTPPGVPEDGDGPGLAAGGQGTEPPAGHEASGDEGPATGSTSGGTIAVEDEQPDPDTTSEETAEQQENTEASTEQPSQ
ncbi:hypothetical protein SAMN04488570_1718 [Nocardioides scoriae]|uniref:Uncharacterized protein n=1 Tax=Nocardioides scoriae TaxID=642780 RepID=A0A1H1RL97_9ACTN|nr:hypothetical protein [Nocardioides scoriae]SDS36442.1 hypothetical protein SAMN04488570_1718 [Nocardioides scoriae]